MKTVQTLMRRANSSEAIKKMKADASLTTCPMLCLTDSTDYPEVHRQTRETVAATPNTTVRNFTSADRTEVIANPTTSV